ncbi:MAG: MATE family efflux transporter, partial [Bacillota bacterium]|nr:MATE family efflux transporter [Bacillota bacterium]
MEKHNERYLIEYKPMKAIWLFSIPLIIGNFFQQTYTMVDSMVVGRYVSADALAAIGASYAFTNIFIWLASGGGIGASVIVSHYFGEKKYKKMKTSIYSALIAFLLLSILLAIVGLISGKTIMTLLKTPESVLDDAMIYLNIYFCGLPFLFMYNIISSMFNAVGKSKIPLYFLIFSSVFNIA